MMELERSGPIVLTALVRKSRFRIAITQISTVDIDTEQRSANITYTPLTFLVGVRGVCPWF